jgi:hypothetical protein
MTLEMLGVPEDYLWIKFTQLAGQPPPSAADLFREYFEELAGYRGWNSLCHYEIWSEVLPWEQHFQWTNLSNDLRGEHRKKYPIELNLHGEEMEIPPGILGDEAMLSKPPTAAEPLVTSDKPMSLNGGAIPNRVSLPYSTSH